MADFLLAKNPEPKSQLPYVVYLPLAGQGIWLKAKAGWPREARVYCHPYAGAPSNPEILERVPVIACARRGNAVDLVLARGRNRRSQFIFVTWRGRPLIFWQTAKTVHSVKPGLRIPHRNGPSHVPIYVDARERYGYTFAARGAPTIRCALAAGDYAAIINGRTIAAVERKTAEDFIKGLVDGSLTFAMAELAELPRAAVAVEGRYSQLLRYQYTRVGFIPHLLAQLIVRYPNVPVVFLESHKIAEEWTYRLLAAAYANSLEPFVATEILEPNTELPLGTHD